MKPIPKKYLQTIKGGGNSTGYSFTYAIKQETHMNVQETPDPTIDSDDLVYPYEG